MKGTKRITTLSLLCALSLVIFIIESQIPPLVPIAGIKMGLANIITLICIHNFKKSDTFLVISVRIILSSVFCGTPVSFIYSIVAGYFSAIIMMISNQIFKENLLWVTSVFGAIAHNLAQIAVAIVLLSDAHIIYYLPILIISAIITGFFTGICATIISKRFFNGVYRYEKI